jgi:hypothetical protein
MEQQKHVIYYNAVNEGNGMERTDISLFVCKNVKRKHNTEAQSVRPNAMLSFDNGRLRRSLLRKLYLHSYRSKKKMEFILAGWGAVSVISYTSSKSTSSIPTAMVLKQFHPPPNLSSQDSS